MGRIAFEKLTLTLLLSAGLVSCSDKTAQSETEKKLTSGRTPSSGSKGETPSTPIPGVPGSGSGGDTGGSSPGGGSDTETPPVSTPSNPGAEPDPISDPVTPPSPVVPPSKPTPPRQVINGWIDEYSEHVEGSVGTLYPSLLTLSPDRMTRMCPRWSQLNTATRKEFWSALLWSIAGPESSRNRTVVFIESSMSKDPVTGYQVRSEGLLQLSYQDVKNYKYNGDISWEKDREMAIDDYEKLRIYGNPERTILNAYSNLSLGLFIMNRLLLVTAPKAKFEDALGKYWSSMRTTNLSFAEVMMHMTGRIPTCFK